MVLWIAYESVLSHSRGYFSHCILGCVSWRIDANGGHYNLSQYYDEKNITAMGNYTYLDINNVINISTNI